MRVLLATTCVPDDRKTVAASRALAAEGFDVTVGGDRFLGQAYYSRSCRRRIHYPHPGRDPKGFIDSLVHYLAQHNHDVLLPMNDYTTIAVVDHREELEPYVKQGLPSRKALHQSLDKYEVQKLGRRIGIDTPTTYAIADGQALEEIGGTLSYPCVVKLRRGAGAVGLSFPESLEQLKQVFERRRPTPDMVFDHDNLLVQEYIPGEVHDACLLFHEGEVRASLTQYVLRMYPSRGGVGTVVETTDEPQLIERAVALLESLKWHGPAEVEFKIDTRDGRPKLIEVNGRYWGGLDLSIRAGVNFPLLACRMARDGDVEPVFHYQTGLRYRWPPSLRFAGHSGKKAVEVFPARLLGTSPQSHFRPPDH